MYGGHRKFGFEYLPKARNRDDLAAKGVLAISEAYAERFGNPENFGKYPDDWQEPEIPDIPDEPDDPPVKPDFNWKGEWNNNKGKILAVVGVIVLVIIVILVTGC